MGSWARAVLQGADPSAVTSACYRIRKTTTRTISNAMKAHTELRVIETLRMAAGGACAMRTGLSEQICGVEEAPSQRV
jgi:hypothetical protein